MDYGFLPTCLVLAHDISQVDNDALILNADVYAFPLDLDLPVSDPSVDTFFEGIHIPTDWLTPSTSYRELLRQLAGMFQFNQRYGEISGGESLLGTLSLDNRLNNLSSQQRVYFDATVEHFGYPSVGGNPTLRFLVKRAGSFWDSVPFLMGGYSF